MEKRRGCAISFIFGLLFSLLLIVVSFFAIYFWLKLKSFEPQIVFHYVPPERSFIYSQEEFLQFGIEDSLKETVIAEREKLIKSKKSFIDVDLQKMELTLYKEGEKFKVFPIQAKGAEWFWGETPPGLYSVEFKAPLLFSTAANAWMPYAIQFYGNYFIHGWPYTPAGTPISSRHSGGCIRLLTKDASFLFEFAEKGMPILVFDEKICSPLPALIPVGEKFLPPQINAQAILIADLDTGEVILSKEMNSEIYAGPAVTVMFALVASENVNLEKRIVAKTWMFEGIKEGFITPGKSYRGDELLRILISKPSKEATMVLSRFLTPERFVEQMNKKAKAIGMKNTNFEDILGISENNVTTLYDVARMMRYIKNYRKFILEMNETLVGPGGNETQTILAVLKMYYDKNIPNSDTSNEISQDSIRFIFIGIANSSDPNKDLNNILIWLENNFNLKKIESKI